MKQNNDFKMRALKKLCGEEGNILTLFYIAFLSNNGGEQIIASFTEFIVSNFLNIFCYFYSLCCCSKSRVPKITADIYIFYLYMIWKTKF